MNRWSVALYDPDDLTAPVAEPTLVTTPTFKVARNGDPGDGSVTVQATDAQAALIAEDQFLVLVLDGNPIHAVIVDEINYVTKAETPGQRTLTISGPGVLALLEDAIVEPATGTGHLPVEEVRQFNWRAVDFDDSGPEWVPAFEIATVTDVTTFWPGLPSDFPDYGEPDGSSVPKYIGVPGSDETDAPADKHNYYRRHFTVASELILDPFAAADNEGDGHLDSVEVLRMPGFGATQHVDGGIKISAGEHVMAWHQHNYVDDGAPGGNPGMLIYTLGSLTPDGLIGEIITFSGSLTLVCADPDQPPGMAVTEAFGKVLDEAQAATPPRLAAITYDFTPTEDSNGLSMAQKADLSARVGDDLLTFGRQCVDSGYCDMRMKVESDGATGITLTFQVFRRGTMGVARDVHPNYTTLEHRRKAASATSALVKWRDTYTSYESMQTPAKRVFLRSEQDPSEVAALERTGIIIDDRKSPLTAVSATIEPGLGPNANEPFTGFVVGDTLPILMPDDAISHELVESITFGIDDAGNPRWQIGIKDRILEAEERIQRVQKRMVSGALAGQSDSPSTLNTLSNVKGSQYRLDHEKFSFPGAELESTQFQVSRTKDLFWLEVRLDEIWPDDVTVVVRLNDTTDTLSCTVAAGDQLDKVWYAVGTQKITTTDFYTLKITAPAAPPRLSATLALR